MWLLLIFVLIPIVEIGLFIQVGGWLGLWPTLGIVVLTAFIGTQLLRAQGVAAMARLQSSMAEGKSPVDPMVHGALILVAGVLLLTPGFFTDGIGFALLIPPIRAALIKWGAARVINSQNVVFTQAGMQGQPPRSTGDSTTVEAEYIVLDDDDTPRGSSGWTKGQD